MVFPVSSSQVTCEPSLSITVGLALIQVDKPGSTYSSDGNAWRMGPHGMMFGGMIHR